MKAPLPERHALLDAFAQSAKGTAAERIALFVSMMVEAPEAAPAPVAPPSDQVKAAKVEAGTAQARFETTIEQSSKGRCRKPPPS